MNPMLKGFTIFEAFIWLLLHIVQSRFISYEDYYHHHLSNDNMK